MEAASAIARLGALQLGSGLAVEHGEIARHPVELGLLPPKPGTFRRYAGKNRQIYWNIVGSSPGGIIA
jgi:hypothetical protein